MSRSEDSDAGISTVLGTMLMLALMLTLVPGAMLMRAAVSDEMQAQREAAERAAYCARHERVGPPTCKEATPMRGYDCVETEGGVWVCRPQGVTIPSPTPPIP